MIRGLQILDRKGEWVCPDGDGPWSLGGNTNATVVLPEAPERVLAYIGHERNHCFIQPAADDVTVRHNGRRLTRSAWLEDGDRLSLGGHRLRCHVVDEYLRFEIVTGAAAQNGPASLESSAAAALQAPESPPRAAGDGVAFRSEHHARRWLPGVSRRTLKSIIYGASAVLLLAVGFVLLATPVDIQFDPAPERMSLGGFPPPLRIAGRYLVVPGRYRVRAELTGYQSLDVAITVSRENARFDLALEKLPGRLSVSSPPLSGATVKIDGVSVGVTPLREAKVAAGQHRLEVAAERYLPVRRDLDMIGMDEAQEVAVTLLPAWAVISLGSRPEGAAVDVDGQPAGQTPLRLELLQGIHRLTLRKPGFDTVSREIEVAAGVAQRLDAVVLPPTVGRIAFSTAPAGATVTLDTEYAGVAPLELRLAPGRKHTLRAALPGFLAAQRELTVKPGERRSLHLALEPEFGIVFVRGDPPDAKLTVDGQPRGDAVQRLRLTTVPHRLEISKPGYVTYTTEITPRAGISAQVDVKLKTLAAAKAELITPTIRTAAGQVLRLIAPGAFTMGASRREPGRRANERVRRVVLSRAFYVSERVVTNAEFQRFKSSHSSGSDQGQSLNLGDQPVVSVSWDDAARYLNWLGAEDKLPPAYRESEGHMVSVSPPSPGYRLPSEAEWAYAARVAGGPGRARYAWGTRYPPTGDAGNFADVSARGIVPVVLNQYNDNFPVSAPVGRFPANPAGLFDMGSNVAEWCEDFYSLFSAAAGATVTDPKGPDTGVHHVVRGASWRSSSISRLRLSYRDYSAKPRNDLGFRIARYADSP